MSCTLLPPFSCREDGPLERRPREHVLAGRPPVLVVETEQLLVQLLDGVNLQRRPGEPVHEDADTVVAVWVEDCLEQGFYHNLIRYKLALLFEPLGFGVVVQELRHCHCTLEAPDL